MYYVLQYLKHLFTSTNQHGVHSPFVYKYITKCLYIKPKYKASKTENVLLKSIPYFSVEKLKIDSKDSSIGNRILMEFGLKSANEVSFDLMYQDHPTVDVLNSDQAKIHNDSMLVLGNIHRTKSTTKTWEALKQNKKVTVSIDLFYCGVLFFRKEQMKEHFKIWI